MLSKAVRENKSDYVEAMMITAGMAIERRCDGDVATEPCGDGNRAMALER